MTALVYVDSLPALDAAKSQFPAEVWVTDNPSLAADPRTDNALLNIDRTIDQPTAGRLGERALFLAAALDQRLQGSDLAGRYGLEDSRLQLAGVTTRLFSSLLYRSAVMAAYLAENPVESVHLKTVGTPRWEIRQPLLMPRFAAPYRTLSEHGFFAGLPVSVETIFAGLPDNVNDTAIDELSRRIAMLPLPILLLEVARRLGLARNREGRIVFGGENEAIREAMPWLAARGFNLHRSGKLTIVDVKTPAGFENAAAADPALDQLVGEWLDNEIAAAWPFTSAQVRAIRTTIITHLTAGLDHLGRQIPEIRRKLTECFDGDDHRNVLITNGLFGPLGAEIYRICHELGIRVIDFEHGVTTGLARLSQVKIAYSEVSTSDVVLACSDHSANTFARTRPESKVVTIGLADQTRNVLRPRLQRWLARKRLTVGNDETVVMHASTLPYFGNVRPGLSAPAESVTFDFDRKLITEAYADLPHRVFFKQYPTQRFPHEPGYAQLMPSTKGIRFLKNEDFRYIRAAADVLVTSTPTSTLGWCVGSGVPIVWLDSELINPLVDNTIRDLFRDSFLFIDIDTPGWAAKLHETLNRPLEAICADWQGKQKAREALFRSSLKGPPGSTGRRAARAIVDLIEAIPTNAIPETSAAVQT